MNAELTYFIAWVNEDDDGNEMPVIATPMTNVINGATLEAVNDSEALSLGRLVWLEAISGDHGLALALPMGCQYAAVYASTAKFPVNIPHGPHDPEVSHEIGDDFRSYFANARMISKLDGIPMYLPYSCRIDDHPSPFDGESFTAEEYMDIIKDEISMADLEQKTLDGYEHDRYKMLFVPLTLELHESFAQMAEAQVHAMGQAGLTDLSEVTQRMQDAFDSGEVPDDVNLLRVPEAYLHSLVIRSVGDRVRAALLRACAKKPQHITPALSAADMDSFMSELDKFLSES
jgi:hypothetical protein